MTEAAWTKEQLEACYDDTVPPGIIRIDGHPFPLVEFCDD